MHSIFNPHIINSVVMSDDVNTRKSLIWESVPSLLSILYDMNAAWYAGFSCDPYITHQFLTSHKTPDLRDTLRYQIVRHTLWQKKETIVQCKQSKHIPLSSTGISPGFVV